MLNMLRRPTHLLTLKIFYLQLFIGTSVYRRIQTFILSGSTGQLPLFPLPALGIEPGLPVWVEYAVATGPYCPQYPNSRKTGIFQVKRLINPHTTV